MARNFNGTSSHFTIADHSALTLPDGAWTLAGWINIEDNDWANNTHVLSWNYRDYTPSVNLRLIGGTQGWKPNEFHFGTTDNSGNAVNIYTTGNVAASGWRHLAIRRTAASEIAILVDGVVLGTSSNASYGAVNHNSSWFFGVTEIVRTDKYWRGGMAEWAKWNAELTTEQIAALAAGVRPTEIGTRPAWYMPMLGGLEEEIAGLAVTNSGTTIAEHPPKIVPAGQYI